MLTVPWREKPPAPEVAFQRLWATRNLALLMIGAGGYITWRGIDGWSKHRAFPSAADSSLGVTLAVVGLAILWTYLDAAVLHRDEPMEYWAEREHRTRPRIMRATQMVAATGIITFAIGLALGTPSVAGAACGPAGFASFVAVANWTGGIRPLFPER
jgi:hypothetical protein